MFLQRIPLANQANFWPNQISHYSQHWCRRQNIRTELKTMIIRHMIKPKNQSLEYIVILQQRTLKRSSIECVFDLKLIGNLSRTLGIRSSQPTVSIYRPTGKQFTTWAKKILGKWKISPQFSNGSTQPQHHLKPLGLAVVIIGKMSSGKRCNLQNQMRSGQLIEQSSHVVAAHTLTMSTFSPYLATLVGNLNIQSKSGRTKQAQKKHV